MPAPWLFLSLSLSLSLSLRLPLPVLALPYSCIVLFLAREQAGHCGGTRGAEARVSGRGGLRVAVAAAGSAGGRRLPSGGSPPWCCLRVASRCARKDDAARCRGAGVTAFDLGVRPCPVQQGRGQRQRCPRAFPQRPAFPRTCKQKARRRHAFQKLPWRVGRALPSRTSPACPRGQVRRRDPAARPSGRIESGRHPRPSYRQDPCRRRRCRRAGQSPAGAPARKPAVPWARRRPGRARIKPPAALRGRAGSCMRAAADAVSPARRTPDGSGCRPRRRCTAPRPRCGCRRRDGRSRPAPSSRWRRCRPSSLRPAACR